MNTLVTEELTRLRLNTTLGRGEKEAIAFCKMETAKFATNDRLAQQFAQNYGVSIISLQAILRGLWVSGMMTTVEVMGTVRTNQTNRPFGSICTGNQ